MKKMKQRKVKFKKWVPIEWHPKTEGKPFKKIEGTSQFEKDFVNDGFFHQWGVTYREFDDGIGNFSVALIEAFDGVVHEVLPSNFKFIK